MRKIFPAGKFNFHICTTYKKSVTKLLVVVLFSLPGLALQAQNQVQTIAVSTPQSDVVTYGSSSSTSYNVKVTPAGLSGSGGSTTLSLNWTGATPSGINYAFTQSSVSLPDGSESPITVTLTITSATGTSAGNYNFTVAATNNPGSVNSNPSSFVVNQAPLIITASAQVKTYGTTVSVTGVLNSTFTVSGLVNTDAVSRVTLGYGGGNVAGAATGTYTITPSAIVFSKGSAGNYTIVYNTGILTVNPAALTITASAQVKGYGVTVSTTGVLNTTFTVSGLQNTDAVSRVTLGYSGTPSGNSATAPLGTYTITPSAVVFSKGSAGNYTIVYNTGILTITKGNATTTISTDGSPSCLGSTVTFTATIASALSNATGTIQFFNGTTQLGTVTVSSGTGTFSISGLTTGSYAIKATYSGDGNYNGSESSLTQDVNIPPSVTADPHDATTCAGTSQTFSVTAAGTSLIYLWQYSANGTTGWVPVANNTPPNITYDTATTTTTATLTVTASPAAANKTYYYRCVVNNGLGCSIQKNSNAAALKVNANNTAGAPSSNPTLCINTAISPAITIATTGATGIGSAMNLPAGLTATFASNTIRISGTPTASGTFNYSIPLTGGCGNVTATGTITVRDNNTVTTGTTTAVCINTGISPGITHTTTGATGISNDGVPGANGLPAGVSATWANNTITISGTPTSPGTFSYIIPLTGGCSNVNATGTIMVADNNAIPVSAGAISGLSQPCTGGSGLVYSVPNIPGINYTWTVPSGWTFTGQGSNAITITSPVTGSDIISVTAGTACGQSVASTFPVTVIQEGEWKGVSSDWNNPQNWCNGVPNSTTDVIIPATETGTYYLPRLTFDAEVRNISIAPGAELDLNGHTLEIDGAFTGTGKLKGSATSGLTVGTVGDAGTVYFDTASGYNQLKTLNITNPAGKLKLGDDGIGSHDTLNIVAGNAGDYGTVIATGNLDANGVLTLKSDANGTAQVGQSIGTITGNVTVERYIPPMRAWRFLAVPFSSSTQYIRDAWQEGVNNYGLDYNIFNKNPHPGYGTHITGNNYSNLGYDFNTTTNASLKVWNAVTDTWDLSEPYTATTNIAAYPAYCIFVRGSRAVNLSMGTAAPPDQTVLRATGVLNQNGQRYTQSYNGVGGNIVFVGNPYASSIDITGLLSRSSGIDANKFWVWDPRRTGAGTNNVGGYVSYSHTIMVPDPSPSYPDPLSITTIESGQAFMVQLSGSGNTSASMSFEESDKVTTQANTFGRPAAKSEPIPVIYTNLMVPTATGLFLADGVAAGFGDQFSAAVDGDDAIKLWNFDENLALVRGQSTLGIEFRPVPLLNDTLFYRMYLRQEPYVLKIFTQNFDDQPLRAWLVDKYLNIKQEVNLHDTTLYNFTPNKDTNSYRNRFMMVLNHVYTATPVPVTKVVSQEDPNTTGLANSMAANSASGVSIYPNPVKTGEKLNLRFGTMDKGRYRISINDITGKKVLEKTIDHSGGSDNYTLYLSARQSAGNYILKVTNENGYVYTTKLVIAY